MDLFQWEKSGKSARIRAHTKGEMSGTIFFNNCLFLPCLAGKGRQVVDGKWRYIEW